MAIFLMAAVAFGYRPMNLMKSRSFKLQNSYGNSQFSGQYGYKQASYQNQNAYGGSNQQPSQPQMNDGFMQQNMNMQGGQGGMQEQGQGQGQSSGSQLAKEPARRDTCLMFISGVIGTDPKESYLSNGHYVLNFALAVQGHFVAIHDWE